jgi:hypothetical protein
MSTVYMFDTPFVMDSPEKLRAELTAQEDAEEIEKLRQEQQLADLRDKASGKK